MLVPALKTVNNGLLEIVNNSSTLVEDIDQVRPVQKTVEEANYASLNIRVKTIKVVLEGHFVRIVVSIEIYKDIRRANGVHSNSVLLV